MHARTSVRQFLDDLKRHGVLLSADGRIHASGDAPFAMLMRAHRNRRALMAALRAG